jgi:hypothetical protein
MANRYISKHSPDYPVGRSRLEALSVMACAFIMSMASIEGEVMTGQDSKLLWQSTSCLSPIYLLELNDIE